MKILIVDDSLMDRKMLASLLKRSGVENEVLQAGNGEEGIEILGQNFKDICLILLDWQMPKMDGIEFMRTVVKIPEVASIPIIMITASSNQEDKALAREANPNLAGYLIKPYKPDALLKSIKPFIS